MSHTHSHTCAHTCTYIHMCMNTEAWFVSRHPDLPSLLMHTHAHVCTHMHIHAHMCTHTHRGVVCFQASRPPLPPDLQSSWGHGVLHSSFLWPLAQLPDCPRQPKISPTLKLRQAQDRRVWVLSGVCPGSPDLGPPWSGAPLWAGTEPLSAQGPTHQVRPGLAPGNPAFETLSE